MLKLNKLQYRTFFIVSILLYGSIMASLQKNVTEAYQYVILATINIMTLLLINFLLSAVIFLIYWLLKNKQPFKKIYKQAYYLTVFIGFLAILGGFVNSSDEKLPLYKETVKELSEEPIKEVGNIETEFLSGDNFYENFQYHYVIKFPQHFKLNYGIGKYAQILAYDENLGYQIAINCGNLHTKLNREDANKLIEHIFNKSGSKLLYSLGDELKDKGGFSEIRSINKTLVEYSNQLYIKNDYEGTKIINNEPYDLIVTDYMTYFDESVYHIYFESHKQYNSELWRNEQIKVMASFKLSNSI